MNLKRKALLKAVQKRPYYVAIPFVPLALMVGNFVMSLAALRKVRQLSLRMS